MTTKSRRYTLRRRASTLPLLRLFTRLRFQSRFQMSRQSRVKVFPHTAYARHVAFSNRLLRGHGSFRVFVVDEVAAGDVKEPGAIRHHDFHPRGNVLPFLRVLAL